MVSYYEIIVYFDSKCQRAFVEERQIVLLCCSNKSGIRGICLAVS